MVRSDIHSAPSDSPPPAAATRAARAGALAVVLAAAAFAVWSYAMPEVGPSFVGIDAPAAGHFRATFGLSWTVSPAAFRAGLGLILALGAAAYLALGAALAAGGRLPARAVGAVSVVLALVFALLVPPILSSDVYSYAGYARLALVHHLDPTVATQADLLRRGDPIAPLVRGAIASPYGPLWTIVSLAAAAPVVHASLWAQVAVFKLVASLGFLALAAGGSRLAERLAPGQGPVAFAALALNPFFLIEGPGNGHNDVVVAACVAWALVAVAERRWGRAFALVGAGGAIKFVPLLLAPWLAVRARREGAARGRPLFWVGAAALLLAPLALCYLPFWRGAATFAGLHQQWAAGRSSPAALAAWRTSAALVVLAAAYGVGVRWAARDLRGLVAGWVGISTLTLVLLAGSWFPWYWIWPFSTALVRWDRRGQAASLALFCVTAGFTVLYAAAVAP
ncbi:MAG TPA: hypothetical protein VKZ18_15585 [Polyangia bacterium]|nr:hypothetical protein [Polyangia bacterium]